MYIIVSDSTNPEYNLALEESVFLQRRNCIIVWQNENSVIIGRNQNIYTEVNLKNAEKYGTRIVRRITGGGAVYHDLQNVNFSFCFYDNQYSEQYILNSIISFLRTSGVPAVFSGRNDITAGNKKISGCASLSKEGFTLLHGTLLFDSDSKRMEQLLCVSETKLHSKGISSVRSRVGAIKTFVTQYRDTSSFKNALTEYLTEIFSAEYTDIPQEQTEKLIHEKFSCRKWNFGRNPSAEFISSKKFDTGEYCVHLELKGDYIRSCCFTGDFIGKYDISLIENKLQGISFQKDSLISFYENENITDYLGKLTINQWLSLMSPYT